MSQPEGNARPRAPQARGQRMMGELGILNVGAGDTKLSFDKSNPAERIRAARIVKDMIRRGYALLIEVNRDGEGRPVYERAIDFHEDTCEYVIADFDPVTAQAADEQDATEKAGAHEEGRTEETRPATPAAAAEPTARQRGRRPRTRRVAADSTKGVAVARSAGG